MDPDPKISQCFGNFIADGRIRRTTQIFELRVELSMGFRPFSFYVPGFVDGFPALTGRTCGKKSILRVVENLRGISGWFEGWEYQKRYWLRIYY